MELPNAIRQALRGGRVSLRPGANYSPAATALGDCTSSCLQAEIPGSSLSSRTCCLRQQRQPRSVIGAGMSQAGASRTLPPMAGGCCCGGGEPIRLASPPAGSDCSAGSEQSCLPVQPAAAADRGVCSPPPPSPAASRQSAPACLELGGRCPSFDHASRDEAIRCDRIRAEPPSRCSCPHGLGHGLGQGASWQPRT